MAYANQSIFRNYRFWLIIVGILLLLAAIAVYMLTELNQLILVILGAIGFILLLVGTIMITIQGKKDDPSLLKETGALIDRQIKVVVPAIGTVAEKATVKGMQTGAIVTLKASNLLNNALTKAVELTGKAYTRVKKIVYVVVLGVLLSEVGIGEAMIVGELGSLLGGIIGPTAGSAVASVAGSAVGSLAGGGSTALGSAAASGLSSLGGAIGSSTISSAGSALGSTAGQAVFAVGQGVAQKAGGYALEKGSDKLINYLGGGQGQGQG